MTTQQYNRRQLLTLSSATLGGLLLSGPLAMAGTSSDLEVLICGIIYKRFPKAALYKVEVEVFVSDLVHQRIESLEPKSFLKAEALNSDRTALERYVMIEFMQSPLYLKILDAK